MVESVSKVTTNLFEIGCGDEIDGSLPPSTLKLPNPSPFMSIKKSVKNNYIFRLERQIYNAMLNTSYQRKLLSIVIILFQRSKLLNSICGKKVTVANKNKIENVSATVPERDD